MGTARDLGLLVLRLAVGATSFSHGAQKLSAWVGTGESEEIPEYATGSEPGESNAALSGALEAGGGALLALGLATGPVSAVLAGNMMTVSSAQAPNGLVDISEGYELPVAYALVATALALTGPGRFSIDHLNGGSLNRPWMRFLALVGALTYAGYLVAARSGVLAELDDED